MNLKVVSITLVLIGTMSVSSFAQKGCTTKAGAKNEMKNGLKNGNWIEFLDNSGKATTDTAAPYYCLTVYKKEKKNGLQYEYSKNGKMMSSLPFKNDKLNGVAKYYDATGKLTGETSFKNDNLNGAQKSYYPSGKLKSQTAWTNNQPGATQNFPDTK